MEQFSLSEQQIEEINAAAKSHSEKMDGYDIRKSPERIAEKYYALGATEQIYALSEKLLNEKKAYADLSQELAEKEVAFKELKTVAFGMQVEIERLKAALASVPKWVKALGVFDTNKHKQIRLIETGESVIFRSWLKDGLFITDPNGMSDGVRFDEVEYLDESSPLPDTKQEAIAFAEWLLSSDYDYYYSERWWADENNPQKVYSTSEMYIKYKNNA